MMILMWGNKDYFRLRTMQHAAGLMDLAGCETRTGDRMHSSLVSGLSLHVHIFVVAKLQPVAISLASLVMCVVQCFLSTQAAECDCAAKVFSLTS